MSTEGTKWALGQILNAIDGAKKLVAGLEARPDLSWTYQPKKYQRATWQNRKSSYIPDGPAIERVLKPGTEEERIAYRTEGMTYDQHVVCPSYERELAHRLGEAKRHLESLEADRAKYELAIATWKPVAPTPAKTVKVVHKQVDLTKGARPACNRMMQGFKAATLAAKGQMTKDVNLVTCQRCKAAQ